MKSDHNYIDRNQHRFIISDRLLLVFFVTLVILFLTLVCTHPGTGAAYSLLQP